VPWPEIPGPLARGPRRPGPLEAGQSREALPYGLLLTFEPAVNGFVGPPRPAVFVVLAHLHAVPVAPALRVLGALRGWLPTENFTIANTLF
jgi:hypothetical protein